MYARLFASVLVSIFATKSFSIMNRMRQVQNNQTFTKYRNKWYV